MLNGQLNIYDLPIDIRQKLQGAGGGGGAAAATEHTPCCYLYDIEVVFEKIEDDYFISLDEDAFENEEKYIEYNNFLFDKIANFYEDENDEEVAYIAENTYINCHFKEVPESTNKAYFLNLFLKHFEDGEIKKECKVQVYHKHNGQSLELAMFNLLDDNEIKHFRLKTNQYEKLDENHPVLFFDFLDFNIANLILKVNLDTETGKLELADLQHLPTIYLDVIGATLYEYVQLNFLVGGGVLENKSQLGFSTIINSTAQNYLIYGLNDKLKVENILKDDSIIQTYFSNDALKIDNIIPPEIFSSDKTIIVNFDSDLNKLDVKVDKDKLDLDVIVVSTDGTVGVSDVLDEDEEAIKNAFDLSVAGVVENLTNALNEATTNLTTLLNELQKQLDEQKEEQDEKIEELIEDIETNAGNISNNSSNITEIFNIVMQQTDCERIFDCIKANPKKYAELLEPYLNGGG
jgi:hypothetical protein